MCGIIGITGKNDISKQILIGLKNLEYRGYDSAGVALQSNGKLDSRKVVGGIGQLVDLIENNPISGNSGIGHTRWATHGAPSLANCHPIMSNGVSVVHNGIIENYLSLKTELQQQGYVFQSDTDTEVIVCLLARQMAKTNDAVMAIEQASKLMTGSYAFVAIFEAIPDHIFGFKNGAPLLIGIGEDHLYLGSDASSLSSFTSQVIFLEDGEIAALGDDYKIYHQGALVHRAVKTTSFQDAANKGEHQYFMMKEILEQPKVLATILKHYANDINHFSFPNANLNYAAIKSIKLVACGSSYYAACVAQKHFENLLPLPISVDIASEFTYGAQRIYTDCLYIFISQSGETADTLAALKRVSSEGGMSLSVVNVEESSIARLSQHYILTHAGIEIGVASTKTYTAQQLVLSLLAIHMALKTRSITQETAARLIMISNQVGDLVQEVIADHAELDKIASALSNAPRILYIGRGSSYPIALEGALKLKEISYITAIGIAAGELKHGSISLIDEETPAVVIAPNDYLFPKVVSNAQGIHARGCKIQLLTSKAGADKLAAISDNIFLLPEVDPFISPIIYSIAVQFIAYKVGSLKGVDIDKPRNLAKSVTVE